MPNEATVESAATAQKAVAIRRRGKAPATSLSERYLDKKTLKLITQRARIATADLERFHRWLGLY
jgi:hypothetical protein